MKKTFLLMTLLVLSSTMVYGQKCKAAEKIKDDFAGKNYELWGGKLNTARDMLSGTSVTFDFYVADIDGKNTAYMQILYMQKENDASVNKVDLPKGTKFMVKTDNNEIIEFTAEKSQNVKRKLAQYTNNIFSLSAEINNEQLETLANNTIIMYQVVPEEFETLTGNVSKRPGKKINEQVKCFVSK